LFLVFSYRPSTFKWSAAIDYGLNPPHRFGHKAVARSKTKDFWIFGGTSFDGYMDDVRHESVGVVHSRLCKLDLMKITNTLVSSILPESVVQYWL
jgi:hypothetical protein